MSAIPSLASNMHHTPTAASADSRAGGGRRWDSGLEGAPELWVCEWCAPRLLLRAPAHTRARANTHTLSLLSLSVCHTGDFLIMGVFLIFS